MWLERLLKGSILRVGAAVFASSLMLRLALDLLFQLRFGSHAANYSEVWLYTGVAEGIQLPAWGLSDPTVWLLRAVGVLFPGELEFYGVILSSAVLSSLTAAALYFLVSELYDSRTGFAAGMIYGGMVEPLALSMSGFTHDHLQLLAMTASLLCAVKAVRSHGSGRILWAVSWIVIVYNAQYINQGIWVAAALALAYAGYAVVESLAGSAQAKHLAYPAYAAVMLLGLAAAAATVVPNILSGTLAALPQGRMGSADVMPATLVAYWMRYNILLLLMPYGLACAFRRRDLLGWGLMACGLSVAQVMDRGTRISDLGVAAVAAYAIADWAVKSKGDLMPYKSRWNTTAAFFAAVFALTYILAPVRPLLLAVFALGGAAALLGLRKTEEERIVWAVSAAVAVGLAVSLVYVYFSDADTMPSQAEYALLDWLSSNNGGGKILTAWDRGYMAEVVSGLDAVSTPNNIDSRVHDMLWWPERQAAVGLKRAGVRYVLIGEKDFGVVEDGGRKGYRLFGSLISFPPKPPPVNYAGMYAAYKLASGKADGGYFRLIRSETNPLTGTKMMLYEVAAEPAGGTLIGGIARNVGGQVEATVTASFTSAGTAYSGQFNQTLEADEVREVLYQVEGGLGTPADCALSAQGGTVTFPAVFC